MNKKDPDRAHHHDLSEHRVHSTHVHRFFFFLTSNTKDQQSDEIRMALNLTAAALEAPRQLSKIPRENHFQPRHVQQAKLNIE